MLRPDHDVEIRCAARPGQGPWKARVQGIDFDSPQHPLMAAVHVEIDDSCGLLPPGIEVSAHMHLPLADVEPFSSQPTDPGPLTAEEPRAVFVCPEHGEVLRESGGKCPRDGLALVEQPLAENERLGWWCPMHPQVTAEQAGEKCAECDGMILVPRVIAYRPRGEVLAVPESAVIDTGTRKLVYVDRGDGMFDGIEVTVGPRTAGYFAIVNGLQAGQKVASAGAFLLDAETRLNPNTSTAYFGATTNLGTAARSEPPAATDEPDTQDASAQQAEIEAALAELTPADQQIARKQRLCPVTQLPLGSMGKPVKQNIDGRAVFLCCAGCVQPLLDAPDKYIPSTSASDTPNERP
jgi:hypothetical protein